MLAGEIFDDLDERWRWCPHCATDCWPEPANQRHAPDCPHSTGVYRAPEAQVCTACDEPTGEFYALVDAVTGAPVVLGESNSSSWVVCLGCHALARDPRPVQ